MILLASDTFARCLSSSSCFSALTVIFGFFQFFQIPLSSLSPLVVQCGFDLFHLSSMDKLWKEHRDSGRSVATKP